MRHHLLTLLAAAHLAVAPAPDVRLVGKGGAIPIGTVPNPGSYTRNETRKQVVLGGQPVSEIRLVFGDEYLPQPVYTGAAVPNGGEQPGPNDITVEEALEVASPAQTVRVKFGGSNTVTLHPGDIVESDPVPASAFGLASFPANFSLWARTGTVVASGGLWVSSTTYSSNPGESTRSSTSASSQVMSTGAMTTPSGGSSALAGFSPAAVVGKWAGTPDVSLMILGDSIITGTNDGTDNGTTGGGFVTQGTRSVNGRTIASVKVSRGTDRANSWNLGVPGATAPNLLRRYLMRYCTHLIDNDGTNDLAAGFTAAQTLATRQEYWGVFRTVGKGARHVTAVLIAPRGSSTDSWATIANQTPTSGFAAGGTGRDALNGSMVSLVGQPTGPDETLDPALDWADGTHLDDWVVNGTANYPTLDGIHPSATLHTLAATNRVSPAAANWTTN